MEEKNKDLLNEQEGIVALREFAKKLLEMIRQKITPKHLVLKDFFPAYREFCRARRVFPFSRRYVYNFIKKYKMYHVSRKTKKETIEGVKLNEIGLMQMINDYQNNIVTGGYSIIKIDGKPYYMQIVLRPMEDELQRIRGR